MAFQGHVRDSIRQIDDNAWLIGGNHLLRRIQEPYDGEVLVKDSDGSSYVLSETSENLPDITLPLNSSLVRQVHEAGDASVVFTFGNALILKVKLTHPAVRPEYETLAFLSKHLVQDALLDEDKRELDFIIPTVFCHFTEGDRIYLFESKVPGERLNELWFRMEDKERDEITTRLAKICNVLTTFTSDSMTIVDPWLDRRWRDSNQDTLQKHCEELGMDCSKYVLSHNDLGATNILVDGRRIALIDWDMAGYCPKAWVRTKFKTCWVLDPERVIPITGPITDPRKKVTIVKGTTYSTQIEEKLGKYGFPEVSEAYFEMLKLHDDEEQEAA